MRFFQKLCACLLWFCLVALPALVFADSDPKPPELFIDKGICPFECCTYGPWEVRQDTPLVDAVNGSQIIAFLIKGETVQALTGEVHTRPRKFTVVYPHGAFQPGDILYLLNYVGEGFFKYWHRGKIGEEDFAFTFDLGRKDRFCETPTQSCWGRVETEQEESVWWVHIENDEQTRGWSRHPEHFGKKDACG